MGKSFYQILGISPQASQEVIIAAYRSLSNKFHPDKNGGDAFANLMMSEINAAYEILSDPVKRKIYDTQNENFSGEEPKGSDLRKYKTCPSCGEDILDVALVCKHCRIRVTPSFFAKLSYAASSKIIEYIGSTSLSFWLAITGVFISFGGISAESFTETTNYDIFNKVFPIPGEYGIKSKITSILNDPGYGEIILALGLITLIFILFKKYKQLWWSGGGLLLLSVVGCTDRIAWAKENSELNGFMGLHYSAGVGWWIEIAAALIILAAAFFRKN